MIAKCHRPHAQTGSACTKVHCTGPSESAGNFEADEHASARMISKGRNMDEKRLNGVSWLLDDVPCSPASLKICCHWQPVIVFFSWRWLTSFATEDGGKMAEENGVADVAAFSSWQAARDKLRKWREEGSRQSESVVALGEVLLAERSGQLGDELWTVYEQVFMAALDCRRTHLAESYLQILERKFPGSLRVALLRGMRLEAAGFYDDAEKLYEQLAEDDPSNSAIQKRRIAILKAQHGKGKELVEGLTKYLKKFMSDHEAWMELADTYVSHQEYSKAAFCVEEVILMHPHHHLYHQRCAEIRYTMGGVENLELARKHFAQAVQLNGTSTRALTGLYLTCTTLASMAKGPISKSKKDSQRLAAWASSRLSALYEKDAPECQQRTMGSMLSVLSLADR